MIDKATHDGVLATCNMSDVGPLAAAAQGVRLEADWEVEAGVAPGSKVRPLGFSPLHDPLTGGAKVHGGMDCDSWTNQAFAGLGNINVRPGKQPPPPARAGSAGCTSLNPPPPCVDL